MTMSTCQSRLNPRAVLLLFAVLTVSACATAPTIQTEAAATATGTVAQAADGPPQRGTTAGAMGAARTEAKSRKPVGPVREAGTVFPSALPDSSADGDQMVAHFIDVGQGDATLLEFSCGAVLVDTGGERTDSVTGRDQLIAYLQEFFVHRSDLANTLNLVVLSHPHVDHTDGVSELISAQPAINILNVIDNGSTNRGSGISGQKALQRHAGESGAGYMGISEADITSTSGATSAVIDPVDCTGQGGVDPKISVLWGRVDLDTGWANDANNDSVVLKVAFGSVSFLFTGDLEEHGIEAMLESYSDDASAFNIDVLKVGHHGSKNGITRDLVEATTPRLAVIQSGNSGLSQDNHSAFSYGHPHRDAVNLLLEPTHGVQMTRTLKAVPIGIKGRNPFAGTPPEFTTIQLDRAIYANGWDGNIAVIARKTGELAVEQGF
jgi:competence protein ComEC